MTKRITVLVDAAEAAQLDAYVEAFRGQQGRWRGANARLPTRSNVIRTAIKDFLAAEERRLRRGRRRK